MQKHHWKIWRILEINVHINKTKGDNQLINTGLSKVMEDGEGVRKSSNNRLLIFRTNNAPGTSFSASLSWLFPRRRMVMKVLQSRGSKFCHRKGTRRGHSKRRGLQEVGLTHGYFLVFLKLDSRDLGRNGALPLFMST